MSKIKKLSAKIPFSGFYESQHAQNINDAIESYFDKDGTGEGYKLIPENFYYSFNSDAEIRTKYSQLYLNSFADYFNDQTGLNLQFFFEEVSSPRFYNYETDRMFAEIPFSQLRAVRKYVPDSVLAATIKDNYTSYDGFCSHYSNDLMDWKAKPFTEWDHNEIGTLLEAALIHSGARIADMSYEIMEHALCNSGIDDIVYPYCAAWEVEHPTEDKRAAIFFDISDDAWEAMTEEEKHALITAYGTATYKCPATLELPLN